MYFVAAIIFALMVMNSHAGETNSKPGTLLVYILSVESSYAQDIERLAKDRFDTLQWWIGESGAWRIKTYDIHPHRLETAAPAADLLKLAKENTRKHYRDVISRVVEIPIPSGLSDDGLRTLIQKHGLASRFEWVSAGYLLWLPDERRYRSQTKPK